MFLFSTIHNFPKFLVVIRGRINYCNYYSLQKKINADSRDSIDSLTYAKPTARCKGECEKIFSFGIGSTKILDINFESKTFVVEGGTMLLPKPEFDILEKIYSQKLSKIPRTDSTDSSVHVLAKLRATVAFDEVYDGQFSPTTFGCGSNNCTIIVFESKYGPMWHIELKQSDGSMKKMFVVNSNVQSQFSKHDDVLNFPACKDSEEFAIFLLQACSKSLGSQPKACPKSQ